MAQTLSSWLWTLPSLFSCCGPTQSVVCCVGRWYRAISCFCRSFLAQNFAQQWIRTLFLWSQTNRRFCHQKTTFYQLVGFSHEKREMYKRVLSRQFFFLGGEGEGMGQICESSSKLVFRNQGSNAWKGTILVHSNAKVANSLVRKYCHRKFPVHESDVGRDYKVSN